jgi:hypothetical protein
VDQERQRAEPSEELFCVGGVEERVEGVGLASLAAGVNEECIDVVVAEDGSAADILPDLQHLERRWASIDEVAERPQLIATPLEANLSKQLLQLPGAPLDVAHDPSHTACEPPRLVLNRPPLPCR